MNKLFTFSYSVLFLFGSPFIASCSSNDDGDNTPVEPGTPSSTSDAFFEGDYQSWADATTLPIVTIDFESVLSSTETAIVGNEFSSSPGGPIFSIAGDKEIFVGIPETGQTLTPFSGVNMLYPTCDRSCEGIIEVSFSQNITRFGTYFIDVEGDFATTGLSLSLRENPEFPFTSSKGQNTQTFLGITRESSFSNVFIHFATGPGIDGSAIDDVSYSVGE